MLVNSEIHVVFHSCEAVSRLYFLDIFAATLICFSFYILVNREWECFVHRSTDVLSMSMLNILKIAIDTIMFKISNLYFCKIIFYYSYFLFQENSYCSMLLWKSVFLKNNFPMQYISWSHVIEGFSFENANIDINRINTMQAILPFFILHAKSNNT